MTESTELPSDGQAVETTAEHYRVIIESIGSATPAASAAIAKGFGLPVDQVVACCYRAPASLVDNLSQARADQLADLLRSIGFQIGVQASNDDAPGPQFCYDVAVYVRDATQLHACAKALSDFVGSSETDMLAMLMRPPGVVLGNVSQATIDCVAQRLPDGIELLWSRPEDAHYACVIVPGAGLLLRSVWDDLHRLGIEGDGEGIVATDLEHKTARELWQRHHAGGVLQIINQHFLRFDIRLLQAPGPAVDMAAVCQFLSERCGIPDDLHEMVLASTPITLLEAIPERELAHTLQDLEDLGLAVSAECITFQVCRLALDHAAQSAETKSLLEQLSLQVAAEPDAEGRYVLEPPLAELQARSVHAMLDARGVACSWCELDT